MRAFYADLLGLRGGKRLLSFPGLWLLTSETREQAVVHLGSTRLPSSWTTSARADVPSPKARATMCASPRMSPVMLKADARPLRSARMTSNPLMVA